MKVKNMESKSGNKIANQFIMRDKDYYLQLEDREIIFDDCEIFQSYDSVICISGYDKNNNNHVILDEKYWNYSTTTSKYRNIFLNETTKETQTKIDNGEYILTNLN